MIDPRRPPGTPWPQSRRVAAGSPASAAGRLRGGCGFIDDVEVTANSRCPFPLGDMPASLKSRWSVLVAAVIVGLFGPPVSPASAGTTTSQTVIACFHDGSSGFTGVVRPHQCVIGGYRGRQFVKVPIKGMRWGHWGSNPTRAAFGVDTREGGRVRVIAYRPVFCADGRAWYSRIVVLALTDGHALELRSPTCARR